MNNISIVTNKWLYQLNKSKLLKMLFPLCWATWDIVTWLPQVIPNQTALFVAAQDSIAEM